MRIRKGGAWKWDLSKILDLIIIIGEIYLFIFLFYL